MLVLGIWLAASLLLGAFWALAGFMLGERRSAPPTTVKSVHEDDEEGEAA